MRSALFARYRAWLAVAILPLLASCGGGGGGEACGSCSIGGIVSGLAGTVVLQLNGAGGASVSANGGFTFPTPQPNGTTYAVTVLTQPANQHCSVGSGTGILGGANVVNVAVTCGPSAFSVGGTIAGLAGTVVLQNNGGDDLSRSADGGFTFPASVLHGGNYAVTVLTQPAGQICSVANGFGTSAGANVTSVAVTCSATSFSVGGTVSGLAGTLVLRNNGVDLTLTTDGPFTFATPVAQGSAYGVTLLTKPGKQSCSVTGGSGTIAGANVSDVAVACVNLNVMFVTSTTSDGNLGGLAGANARCTALAGAAGLPGSYMAWLSDINNPPAVVRLGSARGWVRPDGLPFADTVDDIRFSRIFYPPQIDETGAVVPANAVVRTNTSFSGGTPTTTGNSCGNWTTPSGEFVLGGVAGGGDIAWTFTVGPGCDSQARLYCFGLDSSAPLNPAPSTGRFAFMSSAAFAPASGRATADAVCQSEASGAGLPGTYKALLAAVGSSAAARFSTAGATWVRRDGVRVFASAADLGTTTLLAPIDVTAAGNYVQAAQPWVGASSFSAAGTAGTTCGDWSSSSASATGSVMQADRSTPILFPISCDRPHPLICLQE